MNPRNIVLATALAAASQWAPAQTVYRCGNDYSQRPCAGGSQVETPPPPSAADAAQARRGALADARLAEAMEKARLAQEKNAPKAIVIAPVAPEKPAAKAPVAGKGKKAEKKPQDFTAMGPKPAKGK